MEIGKKKFENEEKNIEKSRMKQGEEEEKKLKLF